MPNTNIAWMLRVYLRRERGSRSSGRVGFAATALAAESHCRAVYDGLSEGRNAQKTLAAVDGGDYSRMWLEFIATRQTLIEASPAIQGTACTSRTIA